MVSAIELTKPVGGTPAVKSDLRANLQAAETETSLQMGRAEVDHQHVLADEDATGSRILASIVRWPGETPPAIDTAADALEVLAFAPGDGGSAWHGFLGGKASS